MNITSITQDNITQMSDEQLEQTLQQAVEQKDAASREASEASKKATYCLSVKLLIQNEQFHRGRRKPGKLPNWLTGGIDADPED